MKKITVVGLGTGSAKQLTAEALETLRQAERLVLRTEVHAAAEDLKAMGLSYTTLDALYADADDFEDLAGKAAEALLAMEGPLVYAVPGQGLLEDDTVGRLLEAGAVARVIPGLTALDTASADAAALLPALSRGQWTMIPAARLSETAPDPRLPLVVTSLDDPLQAGEVKQQLLPVFGDEAPCVLVSGHRAKPLALYELDRCRQLDQNSLLAVLGRAEDAPRDFADLEVIMRTLRGPGGCPWDMEQTHETLRNDLVEEAYEAADAIDREDWDNLAEELGDMLMGILLHTGIGQEKDEFDTRAVTDGIVRKMIRRHPHVFGDESFADTDELMTAWEAIKREEHGQKSTAEAMNGVARALPALTRGAKMLKKASKAGLTPADDGTPGGRLLALLAELTAGGIDAESELHRALDAWGAAEAEAEAGSQDK